MSAAADSDGRIARAVFRAAAIDGAPPPYDRLQARIFYPALPDGSSEQLNAGVVPLDRDTAPYPVVIVMPGINVAPDAYRWLATELVLRGVVVVTYSLIAEEMPGYVSVTPGLDLAALAPDSYGSRPSATALTAIIEMLNKENEAGVLAAGIDTGSLVLAGHSAGGTVALCNANPVWFSGVQGAIAYGAHAGAATALGYQENAVLELPSQLPLLLIGGSNDGVIAASAHRYSAGDAAPDRLRQTFDEAIRSERGDCYLMNVEGANHFSLARPCDETTGRAFLDGDETADPAQLCQLLVDAFAAFVADATGGGNRMQAFDKHPMISEFDCR